MDNLLDTVTRLLRYRRSPAAVTAQFRSWKHNNRIVPTLQSQLEVVLEAYGKFREVVYDTQGIWDVGTDVLLRLPLEEGETSNGKICFQVKSFTDLGNKYYMKDLKSQHYDTFHKVPNLKYYFIVLCTDSVAHK